MNDYLEENKFKKTNRLKEILMNENVVLSIIDNIDELLYIIPEIKAMFNFSHNHPHHFLNVWNHTLYALSLSEANFDIRLSLLLHDIGKPHCYQDEEVRHFKGHSKKSSEISNNILKRFNFNSEYIEEICYLIENHDTKIKKEDIETNYELSLKRYLIQYCDALAHHPEKLEKRIKYLKETLEIFKQYKSNIEDEVKNKVKFKI